MLYITNTFWNQFIRMFYLAFFFVLSTQAQNATADKLAEAIKIATIEDAKLHEEALISLKINKQELYKHYIDIGKFFYTKQVYDRSYYYINQSINYAIQIGDSELLSRTYLIQGNVLTYTWKNKQALDAYYKAIKHAREAKNNENESIARVNVAVILRRMKQYNKALEVCYESSKIIPESKNRVNLTTILSEIHLDLKQIDSSEYYINEGLKLSEKLDYNLGLIDLQIRKGMVSCYKKDFEASEGYFSKAEKIMSDNNLKSKKFQTNLNYARSLCFYENGKFNKAVSNLETMIESFGDTIDPKKRHVLDSYLLMAKSFTKIGALEKSNEWYTKYIALNEEFQQSQDQTVNKINKKDIESLGSEIEKLKLQKLKSKKSYLYIIVAFSISVLLLSIALVRYKRKQKSNKTTFDTLLDKINTLEATNYKTPVKEIIIKDSKIANIIKGLDKLEEQEFYLSNNCNLRSVAKKVKTNATYLSKIINKHKSKNFNDYINDLRINYTIRHLKNDKRFRSFSIKSIATEVGYKSDFSFSKHFKAKTGLNPSYYIKQIEQLEQKNNS